MNSKRNSKQEYKVKHIYEDDEVIALPGADLSRTCGFLVVTIATAGIISWGDLDQIRIFQKTSIFLIFISVGFAVASAYFSFIYLNLTLNEIKNPNKILTPKLLLTISISFYFFNIGMWIVVLGGIWSSPFAALLSVSPVLYGLQMLYIEASHEKACLRFIETCETKFGRDHKDSFMKSYKRQKIFSFLPFIIILFSLIIGYKKIDVFKSVEGGLASVLATDWYSLNYALVYYLSVIIALGGTIPATKTKQITKKIFFTG